MKWLPEWLNKLVLLLVLSVMALETLAAPCQKVNEICVEGPSTKVISGVPVARDCWRYQAVYMCNDPSAQVDECKEYRDKGCGQVNSSCVHRTADGACDLTEYSYQCLEGSQTKESTDCSVSNVCLQGSCFDTSYQPDTNFGVAAAATETARQIGMYGADSKLGIFGGNDERCRTGYAGLKNCCKTSGGAKNNASMMGDSKSFITNAAIQKGVGAVGLTFEYFASPYVYDMMYSAGSAMGGEFGQMLMDKAWSNAASYADKFNASGIIGDGSSLQVSGGSFSAMSLTNLSAFGFTAGWGGGASMAGSIGNTYYLVGTSTTAPGSFAIAFNPAMLAISIAIMVIMQLMSCEQDEQMLGMHRGAKLCHYVGSYCSKDSPIGCMETKESYCCYNSKLARIINDQGRPQIGKPWGSPESPDCSGFKVDDLKKLDFSKMDLSEFVQDVSSHVNTPTAQDVSDIASSAQNKAGQITGSGKNTTTGGSYQGDTGHQSMDPLPVSAPPTTGQTSFVYAPSHGGQLGSVVGRVYPAGSGATVEVFDTDALARPVARLGVAVSDGSGNFAVALSMQAVRPLYIHVTGGTMMLNGAQQPSPEYMAIIPPDSPLGAALVVSNRSNSVVNKVQSEMQQAGASFDAVFKYALEKTAAEFGVNFNVLQYY